MSLFGRKEKQELEFLRSQMTPQQLEAADLAMKIKSAREELADITAKIEKESSALSKLKKQVIETDERVLLQSFGFYVPHYAYATSDEYKEKLSSVRAQQKELVKGKCATTGRTDWEVNGSKSKGAKMVRDMQKLLLRAFNAECDDAIEHVRFNNIEACEKKILSSSDAISKLGEMLGISIASPYISLKLDELHHEIMAVDVNEERVNKILPFVTNAQIGDSTDAEFLESLGVGNYDICFVTIGDSFQNSLETTSLLKELGAKLVISRAERDVQEKFLLRNGADKVVYPEKQVAKWASIRYTDDHILDYMEVDSSHAIFEVEVPKEWIGKTVGELDIRKKYRINIIAVKNGREMNMTIIPDTLLENHVSLLVLGEYKAIQKCFHI